MRVATFSLVAQDPKTGDLGVAVASKFLAVGAVVPFAEAGVGAIATQSYANPRYGPQGLALLRQGASPEGVLEAFRRTDPGLEKRQFGLVAATGESLTFTGAECHPWAGGVAGKGFAAQGNLLSGSEVVEAMVETFLTAQAPFPERLLLALKAGDPSAEPATLRGTLSTEAPRVDLRKLGNKLLASVQESLRSRLWSGGAMWFSAFLVAGWLYAFRSSEANRLRWLFTGALGLVLVIQAGGNSGELERPAATWLAPLVVVFGAGFFGVLLSSSEFVSGWPRAAMAVEITRADGSKAKAEVLCRIDTLDELDYYKNGGIMPYVLRNLAKAG